MKQAHILDLLKTKHIAQEVMNYVPWDIFRAYNQRVFVL